MAGKTVTSGGNKGAAPKPAAVTPAAKINWPSIEQILLAKGLAIEEIHRRIDRLIAQFPYGIPEAALFELLSDAFDSGHILATIVEAVRAYEHLRKTGRGPVAHSAVEVS